jgi:uncharacterized lipoprotein YajG
MRTVVLMSAATALLAACSEKPDATPASAAPPPAAPASAAPEPAAPPSAAPAPSHADDDAAAPTEDHGHPHDGAEADHSH